MDRFVKINFSGVGDSELHDGKMSCSYFYVFGETSLDHPEINLEKKESYSSILDDKKLAIYYPLLLNFSDDEQYDAEVSDGLRLSSDLSSRFSFYRREYQDFYKFLRMAKNEDGELTPIYDEYTYMGEWEPVALRSASGYIRDFNISNGRSYQYIAYPEKETPEIFQAFATTSGDGSSNKGKPIVTNWKYWSIVELIPQDNSEISSAVKKSYKVDLNNVWLFKYDFESGAQTQNFSRNEIQTLGQFSKIAQSKANSISGEINCLLGSEIIPYSEGYIERLAGATVQPLSTNEKTKMLQQWRRMVVSKNPKLLRDAKGQKWIVQIMSNSNTPSHYIKNYPDRINFSWKEIESSDNVTIISDGDEYPSTGVCNSVWKKK